MTEISETYCDQLLHFTLPNRDARGRVVRIDGVLGEILSAHDYPPAIMHLLAEALVLAALLGSLLKHGAGQLTMQAQTEAGVVKLLVCDYRAGELRGYVDFDRERFGKLGANPPLAALFGKGYLGITFDLPGENGRYQGIVPLEGETLAAACEAYFLQSEQLPTLIRVGARQDATGCIAGGILIQHLPDGEEGRERLHARLDHPEWEHVSILAGSTRYDELVDRGLSLEALVWRLFHEEGEVRVERGAQLRRGCRCSAEHYSDVIGRFPEAERLEMRGDDGIIKVDCAFCSKVFPIHI